ncbi:MAG: hypothetical protein KKI15_02795 [Proteobacteria bacterium]|nr:hypothetical protein [Pseudomonadota bacterium]
MEKIKIFCKIAFVIFFSTCGTVYASNNWTTGEKYISRYAHTSTTLQDGRILVAGGNYDSAFVQCELYDPGTNSWSDAGSMATGHSYHTATLLLDGRVLVAGGTTLIAELYDPATDTWSSAGNMSILRRDHTTNLLQDGRVLVAGGFVDEGEFASSRSTELYNPVTNTWSNAGDMITARAESAASLLPDGKVLVTGGTTHGVALNNSTETYDPVTDTWSNAGAMIDIRHSHTATLLNNGKVLVAGGYSSDSFFNDINRCELYDPITDSWSPTENMGFRRWHHTSNLLPDGKVLVIGSDYTIPDNYTEVFDPYTGSWTSAGNMSSRRRYHTSNILPDGRVLVIAGLLNDTIEFGDLNIHSLDVSITSQEFFNGTVTSIPSGISCTNIYSQCSDAYLPGTVVNLIATQDEYTTFEGWTGDCSGNVPTCTVTMDQDRSVSAIFEPQKFTVSANAIGNGSGNVTSNIGDIDYQYPTISTGTSSEIDIGYIVTLSATANIDSTVAWEDCVSKGGEAEGNGTPTATCTFLGLFESKTVTTTFTRNSYNVSAIAGENGSLYTDTPTPQSILHGSTTEFTFNADTGYQVASISGCGITYTNSDNTVTSKTETTGTITDDCTVNASFAINQYTVSASAGTNGNLDATTTSPQTVSYGSVIDFTFNADTGYHVANITGCGITYTNSDNTVTTKTETTKTITDNCTISAVFAINTYQLSIGNQGNRSGIVTSDIGNINCPGICSDFFDYGTNVTLTATPGENSSFIGWSGDCTGVELTCNITVNQSRNVTAIFKYFSWPLFLPNILNNTSH